MEVEEGAEEEQEGRQTWERCSGPCLEEAEAREEAAAAASGI